MTPPLCPRCGGPARVTSEKQVRIECCGFRASAPCEAWALGLWREHEQEEKERSAG
jgi:hypothetical protein